MKVIDTGHVYELDLLDFAEGTCSPYLHGHLIFVKREGEGYPGNVGHHPGTNMQEVLRALIDRVQYLDSQISDQRNNTVLFNLRCALLHLERRAAERHGRAFGEALSSHVGIETLPTCPKCGHIGCGGECHD